MKLITQLSRIFTGILFIISGFIKANDPTGFAFKLEEYFVKFHLEFFNDYTIWLAIIICIFEIVVGAALLLGIRIRLTSWLLLLMIVFFTFLTAYSAITKAVTDCGCFGDAIKLTPWQSFGKDVVLLILILIIFFNQQYIKPLLSKVISSIAMYIVTFLATAFSITCYLYLPVKDFLPFKKWNNIEEKMTIPAGAPTDSFEVRLVYTHLTDNTVKEFSLKEIGALDSTWKWKETINKKIREGYKPPIHDFHIVDASGAEQTDMFLSDGYKLVFVSYDLNKAHQEAFRKIGRLAEDWSKNTKFKFWGLTNASSAETEKLRHDNNWMIDFYTVDATPLKMMVRANPGILLINKNIVVMKWSSYNVPSFQQVQKYMN